jgi:hypothetical protein
LSPKSTVELEEFQASGALKVNRQQTPNLTRFITKWTEPLAPKGQQREDVLIFRYRVFAVPHMTGIQSTKKRYTKKQIKTTHCQETNQRTRLWQTTCMDR